MEPQEISSTQVLTRKIKKKTAKKGTAKKSRGKKYRKYDKMKKDDLKDSYDSRIKELDKESPEYNNFLRNFRNTNSFKFINGVSKNIFNYNLNPLVPH